MKQIELKYYDNYFSGDELDCITQPISALADYHCEKNYFFTAFYKVLFDSWSTCKKYNSLTFIESFNYILSKMGLKLIQDIVYDTTSFLQMIKNKIDSNVPVLLLIRRKTLIYDLGNIDSAHGIIVSGYDENTKKILIRDAPHVEKSGAKYQGSGYGLFKLWIPEDLLVRMWSESNTIHSHHMQFSIFTVLKNGNRIIKTYHDMLDDFKINYGFVDNTFLKVISAFDFNIVKFADDEYSRSFRRWLILPKNVIVGVIKRSAIEMNYNEMDKIEDLYGRVKYVYTKSINMLSVYAKRSRFFSEEKIEGLKYEICKLDSEMELCIGNILQQQIL